MAVSKRRLGRQMAVQMLFQSDLGGASVEEILGHFDPAEYLSREALRLAEGASRSADGPLADRERRQLTQAFEYAAGLLRGSLGHREEIDAVIKAQAEHWRLERMPVVDRNILRLAVYELLYESDVPHLVVVDEAIELAKRFGSENSGRFINGLLDGVLKSRALPGTDR